MGFVERRVAPDLSPGLSERGGSPGSAMFPAGYVTGAPFLDELCARTTAAARALAQVRASVPASAEEAWSKPGDGIRRLRLFRRSHVPRATQALLSAEMEYLVGRTSYLHLDDVQRLWLEVALAVHAAERDARIATAVLRRRARRSRVGPWLKK